MAKRSSRRSVGRSARRFTWQQLLLGLTLVPLLIGAFLIFGVWIDVILVGSPSDQVAMGGFYVWLSFVASNAIQRKWLALAGWTLFGAAGWLELARPVAWARIAAVVLTAGAAIVLVTEFLIRRRSQDT